MVSQRFLKLLDEMRDVHVAKNAGYSGEDNPDSWANFRLAEMFGVSSLKGCYIRMMDKIARISSLTKNKNNDKVGESIKDSLLDLAVYSLIAICLFEEEQGQKNV